MKIIFAGGGTAGHINPALAIANELKRRDANTEFLFVGTKRGMETTLVPQSGYDIEYMDVLGFQRRPTPKNFIVAYKAVRSILKSRKVLKKFRPDVVVGTGGYVSGPILYAAAKKGIPTLIHEQNVFAGFSSKVLKNFVDIVAISFEESREYFDGAKKIVLTGNPVRGELFEIDKKTARANLGIGDRPYILAFGGSLGAEKFNHAMVKFIERHGNEYEITLATGERHYKGWAHIKEATPYIHDMAQHMQAADLVVARAGAITVSEITAIGRRSVLVPSPNVTNNHQEYNARALEKQGSARVVMESELDTLPQVITQALQDKTVLEPGIKDATKKLADMIEELAV